MVIIIVIDSMIVLYIDVNGICSFQFVLAVLIISISINNDAIVIDIAISVIINSSRIRMIIYCLAIMTNTHHYPHSLNLYVIVIDVVACYNVVVVCAHTLLAWLTIVEIFLECLLLDG